jgi:hypothetical protein
VELLSNSDCCNPEFCRLRQIYILVENIALDLYVVSKKLREEKRGNIEKGPFHDAIF